MEKNTKKVEDVQGTENQTIKRNDSFTYALKSMKGLIEKMERNKWATDLEVLAMKNAYKAMLQRYIGLELEM